MASRDQRKMGLKAKSILQKRIVNVTSVIKLNFDLFSGRLQEEGLIPVGRYNPEDRVMNKSENATALYGDCMTAVEVNPTKFSVVMDILSEFSLLEAIVQEMTKEGVKAGLMKPRKDRKPSKKEASVKMQADRKRKHRSDDQEVNKKEKKTKRTNWKTTVEISSDSPSSGLLPPSSNSRTVSMGPSATALPILGTITSVTPLRMTRSQLATIKRNICEAIACQPAVIHRLADELYCVGLIIPAVQQTVKFTDKSPYEKADAMIGPAIERVHSDPERNASALMTALNNVGLQHVTTESHLIAAARPVPVFQTGLLTQPHVPLSENVHTSPPVEPASASVKVQAGRKRKQSSDDQEVRKKGVKTGLMKPRKDRKPSRKEGVKAGLMKPRKDRKPSRKEASVKLQTGRKRKLESDDQEVNKKDKHVEKKIKGTSQKATGKIGSGTPSSSSSSRKSSVLEKKTIEATQKGTAKIGSDTSSSRKSSVLAQDLTKPCTELHLSKIARSMTDWASIAIYFRIEQAEVQTIRQNFPSFEDQKYQMLMKWKEKLGKAATYKKLIKVFQELKNQQMVDNIKDIV